MTFDHQLAPGAQWLAKYSFSAPVGRSADGSKRKRQYRFHLNVGISIRANCGSQILIEASDQPYHRSDSEVVIEPSWVTPEWIQNNFNFHTQRNWVHYQLNRRGESYSVLGRGMRRILDPDDALVELACAYRKGDRGISMTPFYSGSGSYGHSAFAFPMDQLFDALNMLRDRGLLNMDSYELHSDADLIQFSYPWIGLVGVTNGNDNAELIKRTCRSPLTITYPQINLFMIDNEEMFFELKLTMQGTAGNPIFIHRESAVELATAL